MSNSSRGFTLAGSIQPGTVIERVYFTVPSGHAANTDGAEHDTMLAALDQAIAVREGEIARMAAHYGATSATTINAEKRRIDLDVRWSMRSPQGVVTDTVAERHTYDGLNEARFSRDTLARYTA